MKNVLKEKFKNDRDYRNYNDAFQRGIEAVQRSCNHEPVSSYLKKNGKHTLAHLFDTVGTQEALKEPRSKL